MNEYSNGTLLFHMGIYTRKKSDWLSISYYPTPKMFQVLIRVNKMMWKEKKITCQNMQLLSRNLHTADCNIYVLENNKARYKHFG